MAKNLELKSKLPLLMKQNLSWFLGSHKNIIVLFLYLLVGIVFGALIRPINGLFSDQMGAETDWTDPDTVGNIFYGLTSLILFVPLMMLATFQGALSGNKLIGSEMQSRFMIELAWPVRRTEMILSLIVTKFSKRASSAFLVFVGTWFSFNAFASAAEMNWTFITSLSMVLAISLIFLSSYILSMAISLLAKRESASAVITLFAFLFLNAIFRTIHGLLDPSNSIPGLVWINNIDLMGWFMAIASTTVGLPEGYSIELLVLAISALIALPLIIAIVLFMKLEIHTR